MEAKAKTKYIRISPRKLRLVIDAIRYQPVSKAFSILSNLKQKGARIAAKTLKSAHANALFKKMDDTRLFVREIKADGGPSLKRYMPRSMGRADVILKRMSHLTVVLGEREVPVTKAKTEEAKSKEPKAKRTSFFKKEKKEKKAATAAQ